MEPPLIDLWKHIFCQFAIKIGDKNGTFVDPEWNSKFDKNGSSVPFRSSIFKNGTSSTPVPEILELIPELGTKNAFRTHHWVE